MSNLVDFIRSLLVIKPKSYAFCENTFSKKKTPAIHCNRLLYAGFVTRKVCCEQMEKFKEQRVRVSTIAAWHKISFGEISKCFSV